MQFLFLSCCSGAEIANEDVQRENTYLGLMHAAVMAGTPAVLGFRWPVSGRSAQGFAEDFYDGLKLFPYSLEHATWWARKQVFHFRSNGAWDETWFSPMLIIQNPDYPGGYHA